MSDKRIADVLNDEDDYYRPDGHRRGRNELAPTSGEYYLSPWGWWYSWHIKWWRRQEGLPAVGRASSETRGDLAKAGRESVEGWIFERGWGHLLLLHPWLLRRDVEILELLESVGAQTRSGIRQGLIQCYGASATGRCPTEGSGSSRIAALARAGLIEQAKPANRLAPWQLCAGTQKHQRTLHDTRPEKIG